jgi:hypothetical protein
VSEITSNDSAALPPKLTALAPVKPLPSTVTSVPPLLLPLFTDSPVTLGAAAAL